MNSEDIIKQEFYRQRYTGSKGSLIQMHHSMHHISLSKMGLFIVFFLPVFFDWMLWINLDTITQLWQNIFAFWMHHINLGGKIFYSDIYIFGRDIYLPFPEFSASYPTMAVVWINAIMCVIIFVLLSLVPKKFLPLTYFIRALLLIQISSSWYFGTHEVFPYDVGDYISGALTLGLYLLFLIPPVLALIYYIFDFSFAKKLVVTALMVLYFIILIPFQYMLGAVIISSWGLLFMPVLYFNFGLILDSLMFIGWYSWAMTL